MASELVYKCTNNTTAFSWVTSALLNAIEGSACLQFYLLDGGLLGSQGVLSALHSADLYTARKTLYNSILN